MAKTAKRSMRRKTMKRKSMKKRGGANLDVAAAATAAPAIATAAQPPSAPAAAPAAPAAANQQPPANQAAAKQAGGKRKSRKLSPWNKFVAKVYAEMKKMDKNASFSQALKEASKRKKKGQM